MSTIASMMSQTATGSAAQDAYQKGIEFQEKMKNAPLEREKFVADTQKAKMEASAAKLDAVHDLLQDSNPQNWRIKRQIAIDAGYTTPDKIPEQFDQTWRDANLNTAKQAKESLAQREAEANIALKGAQARYYNQGGSGAGGGGATGAVIQKLMQEDPTLSYADALAYYKGGASKTGGLTAGMQATKTKAEGALTSFKQQADIVNQNIDKALATISPISAGYGSMLSFLPESDARALNNYLTTIKSNVGLDKLQNMRENSPTGGALGQVSDFENKLLQAVNGALDPGQSDQLKENLKVIKDLYPKVIAEKERAFQQDYGNVTPLGGNPQPAADTKKPALSKAEALKMLRERGHKL